ncbi:MAG: tRNA (N6-threonylcarbamoyladenosine(37)-N6)-methyltransferase TrmO [Chloroflexi bacterium]|nr:tRNA (N6-threonylcarbamoyladenosine(37)-N6)-methyltransferase TrmO [Chloroflexota bacterium]
MESIGWVRSAQREMTDPETLRQGEVEIELRPELAEGLHAISADDLVLVIYYFHLAAGKGCSLRQHPRGDTSRPQRGVFATRSPYRPNPLGVTVARVVAVEGHRLRLRGLDAIDGTPVLDIKNHTPSFDDRDGVVPEGESLATPPPWLFRGE